MEDLSNLAAKSLAVTSQHAGNQIFPNDYAMTAPGGDSGDLGWSPGAPVVSKAPEIEISGTVDVGTPAKRKPSGTPARLDPVAKHANEKGKAGSYDEPSFGRAPGGPGPWKQVLGEETRYGHRTRPDHQPAAAGIPVQHRL